MLSFILTFSFQFSFFEKNTAHTQTPYMKTTIYSLPPYLYVFSLLLFFLFIPFFYTIERTLIHSSHFSLSHSFLISYYIDYIHRPLHIPFHLSFNLLSTYFSLCAYPILSFTLSYLTPYVFLIHSLILRLMSFLYTLLSYALCLSYTPSFFLFSSISITSFFAGVIKHTINKQPYFFYVRCP